MAITISPIELRRLNVHHAVAVSGVSLVEIIARLDLAGLDSVARVVAGALLEQEESRRKAREGVE